MDTVANYTDINRALWDTKTGFHLDSAFYNQDAFLKGASSLKDIELNLLGDISRKDLLHLQCHFGQDTISLAKLGARATGIDFSPKAIEAAQSLAMQLDVDARFLCSDIYELPQHLHGSFDIVFTSYGTIGWLPDMDRWANVVAHFLKPGGTFVIVEFHPLVWTFDNNFTYLQYDYFNTAPILETEQGTYADRDAPMKLASVSWNHPLSEVMQALLRTGLQLDHFSEYDYSPYDCFANTIESAPGKFQIKGMEGKLPMVYALRYVKPNTP